MLANSDFPTRDIPLLHPESLRILIVEDEAKIANFIQKGLLENGMSVDVAVDGQAGVELARTAAYDLAILDVALPRLDGWSVLQEMQRCGVKTRVLFLTARDSVNDRVKGLELGADDYLVKPFAFSELLARVRTIVRRSAPRMEEVIRIADLEIDPGLQRVTRAGRHLYLTPRELQLLLYLARFAGQAVTRHSIAETVWGIGFDTGTNMIEAAVSRLRSKIDDGFSPKLIHTARGVGYVLEIR
jgi:two-component system copper resistance phosphate regulon response regulator CusR